MTVPRRTILHVDMDAFFVSVELRRRPELRGRPVVVGGTGRRGVVAAASYEARQYGVHSAMPSAIAERRCPHAVFLPGDHAHYSDVSRQVLGIMERYTPLIEPLSLDEAFLDVSGALRLFGSGPVVAERLRVEVHGELSLNCSVGVAPNKFLAKLASVEAKPVAGRDGIDPGPGVVVVEPGEERAFVRPLPVERLWGVGPKTLERLHAIGIRRVADLAEVEPAALRSALGQRHADHLIALADGRDDRPVETDREAKSLSQEETFANDLFRDGDIHRELVRLADGVAARVRRHEVGARTITLKVRYGDFTTLTRSATVDEPVTTTTEVLDLVWPLAEQIDRARGVRLLGIAGGKLAPPHRQLRFDDLLAGEPEPGASGARPSGGTPTSPVTRDATGAVDAIRDRFGDAAIAPAGAMTGGRVRPLRPGEQQWGPNAGSSTHRVEDADETCENER